MLHRVGSGLPGSQCPGRIYDLPSHLPFQCLRLGIVRVFRELRVKFLPRLFKLAFLHQDHPQTEMILFPVWPHQQRRTDRRLCLAHLTQPEQ